MGTEMKTDLKTLRQSDWQKAADDVCERIAALRHVALGLEEGPLSDKIANDLILPALAKLGEFVAMVELSEERNNGETDVELRNTVGSMTDSYATTIEANRIIQLEK